MKTILFLILLFSVQILSHAQVYTEKQTRHRFAQLHLGFDLETNRGGKSQYVVPGNDLEALTFSGITRPRFLIGGTHFWGHADFYIAIPIAYPRKEINDQTINFLRGVETVFKYYPWRIEHKAIRPYIGLSLAPFYYQQDNDLLDFGNGPGLRHTSVPLHAGLTLNVKNHLIELGASWNYLNNQDYFISRDQRISVKTPPAYVNLSYRVMLETTLSAEKNWESGRTKEVTERLANAGKLNGIYLGAGLSSAFWLGNNSYNSVLRPYAEDYGISIMPDFTLGYYLHNPDINIGVVYRNYGTSINTYGAIQRARRRSIALEATKYLFDYNGFAVIVGPVISAERLRFEEDMKINP